MRERAGKIKNETRGVKDIKNEFLINQTDSITRNNLNWKSKLQKMLFRE